MKSEKKKPSPEAIPAPLKKVPAAKKKTSIPKAEAPPEISKSKTAPAKAKKTESVATAMEAAENIIAKAAKRVVRATKKFRAAVEEAAPVVKKIRRTVRKTALQIPEILLEGDAPSPSASTGPGKRYSLGATPPVESFSTEGELPEAYGTQKLLLTARDPHWLYAHWDFTNEQLRKCNELSRDKHLVLRIYKNKPESEAVAQVHVHPESRNWFVNVDEGGAKYLAELGYFNLKGGWTSLSISGATLTPPDSLSEDTSVRFATIPIDVSFNELIQLVKTVVRENVPLAEAIMQLRAEMPGKFPAVGKFASAKWTPEQERALSSLITMDSVRRVWIGSLEITELIRRQLSQEISSAGAAQFSLPSSMSVSSLSSPFGGGQKRKGFWFNVNAELIIYGATEPDAKVEIGGRQIKLRNDGTFSFRFILPDGNYDLPAQATSADGDDTRSAHLKFSRDTKYLGEVGAHPQDNKLKKPAVENVS